MDEREFNELAGRTLADLEARLEALDADIDFELAPGGILEIEFADRSKIIVNRHGVNREIWVAARAGGFHFRAVDGQWRDTRDAVELFDRLSQLASQQAGEPVDLR